MNRILTLAALVAVAVGANAQQTFQITVENLGPQPLSPAFFSASDSTFNIFDINGTSSAGIKAIAEGGNTTPMFGIATAAGSAVMSFGRLPGSPLTTGNSSTSTFTADMAHGYLSFAMMLGHTNDGFLGESVSSAGIFLFQQDGTARSFSTVITGLRAWDAGTEQNTQNAADLGFLGGSGNPADSNNRIRIHDTIIPNVGDSWQQQEDWTLNSNLARVTVTPVPEPATFAALGLGIAAAFRRRKK